MRQALAYAIDRRPDSEYLMRGFARPADSVLPPQSWAYNGDVPAYEHDPAARSATAGASRISGSQRHSLSSHHENLHRRKHATAGSRPAAAIARGRNRARYPHLRIRHLLFRRDQRRLPDVFPALDRRKRGPRYLRVHFPLLQVPSATAPTAASSPIRGWMR